MAYTMEEMRNLVDKLNYYTERYDAGEPEISDTEWDKLYFELMGMEETLGRLDQSPTLKIHYNIVSSLKKVTHNHPILSLDKTKNLKDIITFGNNKEMIAMCKMDGLTCSLHYQNRRLVGAETRGDGVIGEDIFHNAQVIPTIPKVIEWDGDITIDGEIICTYENFEDVKSEYKNPRNFAAGSIRLLDSKECAKRKLTFVAWDCPVGLSVYETLSKKLIALINSHFTVAPFVNIPIYDIDTIEHSTIILTDVAKKLSYPIDGIVFKYDNCEYYDSLGATAHHPRGGLAYKFADEEYETKLRDIEYTMGKTGVLTPIAIFDEIEMDGSIVSRANLHNLNIMDQLLGMPFYGQEIHVIKSNMIIPQIIWGEKRTFDSNLKYFGIPANCPCCLGNTYVKDGVLYCDNDDCEGKLINKLDHFCGKKGLDIKGLSKATLQKLIDWGWVETYIDLFNLDKFKQDWIQKSGFGEKSVSNILAAIYMAQDGVTLDKFISAFGIPLIGNNVSKEICKYITSYDEFRQLVEDKFDFCSWDGFGPEKKNSLLTFNYSSADELAKIIKIIAPSETTNLSNKLESQNVVITGKLQHYKNRNLLQQDIINNGGTVSNKITRKTTILINNDINSTSSKNVAAKELGIPIITEADFIAAYLT